MTACDARVTEPKATATQAEDRRNDVRSVTFEIDGAAVTLHDGHAEQPAAPGSRTQIVTDVFGTPVERDVDGDGDRDAVMFLVRDSGGSGTFYYVAATLATNEGVVGTNAPLLGDRIAPQSLEVRHGLIVVNIAARGPDEPMSASPSVGQSKYFILEGTRLTPIPLREGEQVVTGALTYGHEVHTFRACNSHAEAWLTGEPATLQDLRAAYERLRSGYQPLTVVLAGRYVERLHDGFGADYSATFQVTKLISVRPDERCE
jgi:NlpE C-terminal OB domain